MSKSIALGLLGAGAILLAILLTGCSDAPSPTTSARAVPTPTVTAQPGVTSVPTPTPTMAPTHTPTAMGRMPQLSAGEGFSWVSIGQ